MGTTIEVIIVIGFIFLKKFVVKIFVGLRNCNAIQTNFQACIHKGVNSSHDFYILNVRLSG